MAAFKPFLDILPFELQIGYFNLLGSKKHSSPNSSL